MKKSMFKTLPISMAVASALFVAANAQAMDFKVSGQINRALSYADNGEQSATNFVDNAGSNSRFRFTGSQDMGNGLTAGFKYEIGFNASSSDGVDIGTNPKNAAKTIDPRTQEAWVKGDFGKVTFGKGYGAAAFTGDMDLSGTDWIGGGIGYTDYSSSMTFNDGTNKIMTIGDAMSYFTSFSRYGRVQYDSPSLGGTVISASYGNGGAVEIGAVYAGKMGENTVNIGAGYANSHKLSLTTDSVTGYTPGVDTGSKKQTSLSGSILMPSGLNFTLTYNTEKTQDTTAGHDAKTMFGQVGYISGKNHYALNYGKTKDLAAEGVEGKQLGAAYVYDWGQGVQLYASYHIYKLDVPASITTNSINNIKQLFVGTRIKFM